MADTSPDEKIAGVPIARLLHNLEETSYNEGAIDLACRLTDCKAVIEELLAGRATPPSPSTAPTCQTCKGNDQDAPCAYPSKGMAGCLRDARLSAPSTAPEVGELPAPPTLPRYLLDMIGEYGMARTDSVGQLEVQHRWEILIGGIKRYASDYGRALASRPAEVDDEGLPDMADPAGTIPMYADDAEGNQTHEVDGYTAEQYRQGQRDAVAADRARRDQRQSAVPSGRAELTFSDVFELYSAADALHEAGAIVAGVNVRLIADKLVDVGSGAGWK